MVKEDERIGQVESDASAQMAVVSADRSLIEAFEDLSQHFFWYSLARVNHLHCHILIVVCQIDGNRTTCRRVFKSVREEVYHNFVEV